MLIGATVVRGIPVPGAMALLGGRCWYLPRWLGWIPGRAALAAAPGARHAGVTPAKVRV